MYKYTVWKSTVFIVLKLLVGIENAALKVSKNFSGYILKYIIIF